MFLVLTSSKLISSENFFTGKKLFRFRLHLSPVRGLYTERGKILAKFSFILRKIKRGRSRTPRTWKTELNALSFVVLSFVLKVVLPNNKFYVSAKSVLPNTLWSMLTKLLRSVRRSLLNKGQWRKK